MNKFYCPYCNPKYQFPKKSSTGKLICGLCGEDLLKKPFIKWTRVVALVATLSLILPLIYTFLFIIKDQIKSPRKDLHAELSTLEEPFSPYIMTFLSKN